MTATATVSLTEEQQRAVEGAIERIRSGADEVSVGGYAGTGKTTIARELVARLGGEDEVAVCAPTGKAALMLRSKGLESADTVHSLVYYYRGSSVCEFTNREIPNFEARESASRKCRFILCDEASMVNASVAGDIRSLGKPIIWVGDHGQLPPVGEDPGIMTRPNFTLETIHRQAEQSAIVRFARDLRKGEHPRSIASAYENGEVRILPTALTPRQIFDYCQEWEINSILVPFNEIRHKLNNYFRRALGYSESALAVGERLICILNNRRNFIFNGSLGTVVKIHSQDARVADVSIDFDDGRHYEHVTVWVPALGRGKQPEEAIDGGATLFDYGYALTVHKAQGSEWPSVLVVEKPSNRWSMERWRYTAATRAKTALHYHIG